MTMLDVLLIDIQWPEEISERDAPNLASLKMIFEGDIDMETVSEKIAEGMSRAIGETPTSFTWFLRDVWGT